MMTLKKMALVTSLLALTTAMGCEDGKKPEKDLAPTASALATAKPKTAAAKAFAVDKASSKVDFTMEAPKEKIRGRVHGTTSGTLNVDLTDLTKTTGTLDVDIGALEIYKTNIGDDGKPAGDEEKNDLQNKHAKTWLQISEDAPEEARKKFSLAQFAIKEVGTDTKDVTKLKGDERKVTLTAKGDFRLHGRATEKTVKLEVTFKFNGDKVASIMVKSAEPFGIGLAEHEVHPRDTFGSLAAKTLDVLAPKVAKEAMVTVSFSATMTGDAPAEDNKPAAGDKAGGKGS